MNIQGKITKVFDNRVRDGVASKFPNFKFTVDSQDITLWNANKPVCLEVGKNVSVTVQASKKNGSLFVQTREDKSPMMQELIDKKPDTTFNVDDFESDNFNTAVTTIEKDMVSDVELKKSFDKDEYMFVMALTKSSLESRQLNANKEDIDTFIKNMKMLFAHNFK
jgi:hypothetical protein